MALLTSRDRLTLLLFPVLVVPSLLLVGGYSHSPPPLDFGDSTLTRTASEALRDALRTAQVDAERMATVTSLPMKYGIFRGRSAVRDLLEDGPQSSCLPLSPEDELEQIRILLHPEEAFLSRDALARTSNSEGPPPTTTPPRRRNALRRLSSILILLRGHPDAAHEVLLGVDPSNLDEAEYAATHPGETSWSSVHPLDDPADDLIHAAIHRLEGSNVGEGNHTGFENAGYWLGGGPKALGRPPTNPVGRALADRARSCAPRCVAMGVVAPPVGGDTTGVDVDGWGGSEHRIIAGGGGTRTVRVPPGEWDGFAFAEVCRRRALGRLTAEEGDEVSDLQRAELILLLRTELVGEGLMLPLTVPDEDDEEDSDADPDASS